MRAYCDGACRVSNPGECSAAFVVVAPGYDSAPFEQGIVAQFSTYLGPELHTNNYAEYQGLLHLLRWAESTSTKGLSIYCDSALVVNQVNGFWKVNREELGRLWFEANALRYRGNHILEHIKGHSGNPGNEYVDKLCNQTLDEEFLRREQ